MKRTFLFVAAALAAANLFGQAPATPSQQEGPFYPVEKPRERDNDLARVSGTGGMASGELLELSGRVTRADGTPVVAATVEIWQTDHQGIYFHPRAPRTNARDRRFQFYGESRTDAGGRYGFLTIIPAEYGNRPRHIHVKLRDQDGRELLTTQFYFAGDNRRGGERSSLLTVEMTGERSEEGRPVVVARRDIVLRSR